MEIGDEISVEVYVAVVVPDDVVRRSKAIIGLETVQDVAERFLVVSKHLRSKLRVVRRGGQFVNVTAYSIRYVLKRLRIAGGPAVSATSLAASISDEAAPVA